MKGKKILVVGAGISGLLAATQLHRSGAIVKVVEKGRGLGGRMATRRMEGARLDHGAQFMTVRSEEFGEWVSEWKERGWIREWFRRAPSDSSPEGHPRYCGITGMTDVAKALGEGLDVERSVHLKSTIWTPSGWAALAESGKSYHADILILTPPVPQSVELLRNSGISLPENDWSELCRIDYEPCLTGLLVLNGPSGMPDPGGIKVDGETVLWIGDNTRKGISPEVNAVTVHSSAAFARKYWDSPDEERLPLLLEAAAPHLNAEVRSAVIHRWRFNLPKRFWRSGYFWNEEYRMGMAGDAFGGGRVEGAALSGLGLARVLGA